MDRRNFIRLSGAGLGALLSLDWETNRQLLARPHRAFIEYESGGLQPMTGTSRFSHQSAELTITRNSSIFIKCPSQPLKTIVLEWDHGMPPASRVLGDHWERTYGDVWFRAPDAARMPWYFIQMGPKETNCFGVKTGGSSFAAWQIINGKLRLTLDVRNGGNGVRLGSRRLHAADIVVTKSTNTESVFQTGRRFCSLMCAHPLRPQQPVYGINDWYVTYGKNSAEIILDHTAMMSQLISSTDNPPFSVIDSGWAEYSPVMPEDCCWQQDFTKTNHHFPDMPAVTAGIVRNGMRPGVWIRPLCARHADPQNLLLPRIPGRDNPRKPVLDPTIPENLERVRNIIRTCRNWGFQLIKHDFSTNDLMGKWGFNMLSDMTTAGWNFNDQTRTSAEIIMDLYKALREEAKDVYLLGCNTISHFSAGLFELNRIGDDTSGKEWERTRKYGVNTMGFRMIQHNTFYAADGDCVGLTNMVPWEKNKQWMELLAKSSAPLFISAQKEALGVEQKQQIRESFALAAKELPVAEPLDWTEKAFPSKWKLNGTVRNFQWLLIFIFCAIGGVQGQSVSLASPNGQLRADFSTAPITSANVSLNYSLVFNGKPVVSNGSIGFSVDGQSFSGAMPAVVVKRNVNRSWTPLYGERASIPERFNELRIQVPVSGARIFLNCRLYNEGLAWQYEIVKKGRILISSEDNLYRVDPAARAWISNTAQGVITPKPIGEIGNDAERPLTVSYGDSLFAAFGEAALVEFPRMKFKAVDASSFSSKLFEPGTAFDTLASPWRYIIVGNSPGQLLEQNYLVLNLNKPSAIGNTSWIRPGRVLRETTLTTNGSLRAIDFAAKHKLEYIMFDAGWYGREDHDTSDARRVSLDPLRSKGPLDLQRVISYGKSKNVGVILYVNRRALERQLDELLPLYQKWGVKGIKFGFVQVGSQQWTTWLHSSVRKAAAYKMIVDVHDEYRPTGYARTYPNLLTQEGIRGDEETIPVDQTIRTLFTRLIAGPGDNTFCYFTSRVDRMGSHAAQLAKTVCIYSPLQFLFWYDRPYDGIGADTAQSMITEVPEMNWFDGLPVTWDETRVLESHMEDHATIARRKGNNWWLGSLNGNTARTVGIKCNFLPPGKKYTATIYSDDPSMNSRTRVRIETRTVDSQSILSLNLAPKNGLAIRFSGI